MAGSTIVKVAGDDWFFPMIWKDNNHNPIDLTNFITTGLVGSSENSTPVSLTEENGGIIEIDRLNGKWTAFVARAHSANVISNGVSQVNARLRIMVQDSNGLIPLRVFCNFTWLRRHDG